MFPVSLFEYSDPDHLTQRANKRVNLRHLKDLTVVFALKHNAANRIRSAHNLQAVCVYEAEGLKLHDTSQNEQSTLIHLSHKMSMSPMTCLFLLAGGC